MKGAAWAGYHSNRCTLLSVAAAVGFWCRIVFPEPRLDTITIFNGMFSILLSLPSSLKTPYSLCGVTALSCQNSLFFQDGSQPWRWSEPTAVTAYPLTQNERMLRLWSNIFSVVDFSSKTLQGSCDVIAPSLAMISTNTVQIWFLHSQTCGTWPLTYFRKSYGLEEISETYFRSCADVIKWLYGKHTIICLWLAFLLDSTLRIFKLLS